MTDQPLPSAAELTPDHVQRVLTDEIAPTTSAPLPNPAALAPGAGSLDPVTETDGITLRLNPAQEYVAGGAYQNSMLAYARALPDYIDDATRDFGSNLYERMALDSHVAGETQFYVASVLANGVTLLPAFAAPQKKVVGAGSSVAAGPDEEALRKHTISVQIMDFCQSCLDNLSTPLRPVLWDMLEAFGTGNRVAEIVYRWDGAYLMPDRISVKPREAIGFVVDSRGRTIGLLGAIAGQAAILVRPGLLISPSDTPNLLPRKKFAIATWHPKNGDPRGRSAYRPAYNPWWQKRQTEVELAKFVTQFAGSSLFATLPEKAVGVPTYNSDGSMAVGIDGRPIMQSPSDALRNVLTQMRNGGVGVGPFGTDVKNIVAIGAGQPFFDNLSRCNAEISKALLSTALATNDSAHESRAATTSHKDCLDLLVQDGEDTLEEMIRTDILRECVRINFGDAYLPFVPQVSLGAVEEADLAALATGFAAIGYSIAPSQLQEADSMLGFTPRSDDEVAQAVKNASAPKVIAPGAVSPGKQPGDETSTSNPDDGDEDDDTASFTERIRKVAPLILEMLGIGKKKAS